jgi:hypothetical protein
MNDTTNRAAASEKPLTRDQDRRGGLRVRTGLQAGSGKKETYYEVKLENVLISS